jgi:hypothetical protein
MELLLNLAWVLLALPAWWLWRRRARQQRGGFSAGQCLLALGCLVVLLFPVISASDDLSAMRAEMEEGASGMTSMRSAEHGKSVAVLKNLGAVAAITSGFIFSSGPNCWHDPVRLFEAGLAVLSMDQGGRAPPSQAS